MELDVIPNLPVISEENYYQEDEDIVLEELKRAKRKVIIYEDVNGEFNFWFKNLDDYLFAGVVAALSKPSKHVSDVYEFLKYCIEGTRMAKQCTKKGFNNLLRIAEGIKSKHNST